MDKIIIVTLTGLGVLFGAALVIWATTKALIFLYAAMGNSIGLLPLFPAIGFVGYLLGNAFLELRKRKA